MHILIGPYSFTHRLSDGLIIINYFTFTSTADPLTALII